MSYIKKNKITFCLLSQILLIPLASFFVHMFLHCNDIRISDSDYYVAFLVNEKYWFTYTNLTASILHFYLPLYFFYRNIFLILCLPFLYQILFLYLMVNFFLKTNRNPDFSWGCFCLSIFYLMPAHLVFHGYVLTEVVAALLICLFFNLVMLFYIQRHVKYLFLLSIVTAVIPFVHSGMFLFSVFFNLWIMYFANKYLDYKKNAYILMLFAIIIFQFFIYSHDVFFKSLGSAEKFGEQVVGYTSAASPGRLDYQRMEYPLLSVIVNHGVLKGILVFIVKLIYALIYNYILYLVGSISVLSYGFSFGNIAIFFSSVLRCVLITINIFFIKLRMDSDVSKLLLLTFLWITGVYLLGTTNFGTAFRHHTVTDWILIMHMMAFFDPVRFRTKMRV